MLYVSTAGKSPSVSLREAVLTGLAPDKGLYLPQSVPTLSSQFLSTLSDKTFVDIASEVSRSYFARDVPGEVIEEIVRGAFNFPVPMVEIQKGIFVLELFQGPTAAFKDFGARFMARLMSWLVRDENEVLTVLVATSGDTGSAVAQGFWKIPGIEVVILYPSGKVSEVQEAQFTTLGENISALEVAGSFDDCQHLVKQAFSDEDLAVCLRLTSANSINIARLIPQSFYYFWGVGQLGGKESPVVYAVPSGNFGNLTAGVLAKRQGLAVERFVAATNVNDVVPLYLQSGDFEPRGSRSTVSNAMDVGDPSNFARLRSLYGGSVESMRSEVVGASFSDEETLRVIEKVYEESGYVLDPHTAVGYLGLQQYFSESSIDGPGVVLGTAHSAKFLEVLPDSIKEAAHFPDRLKACLEREKCSSPMSSDYGDFKQYLVSRS